MGRIALVIEGLTEDNVLRRVLPDDLAGHGLRLRAAGSVNGAIPVARTILLAQRVPVVLLVDADRDDPESVRRFATESLAEVTPHGVAWQVVVAVPEFEACFFDPVFLPALEAELGRPLSEGERVRAEYEPERVLREAGLTGSALFQLASDHADDLMQTRLMRELREAIETVSTSTVPSSS